MLKVADEAVAEAECSRKSRSEISVFSWRATSAPHSIWAMASANVDWRRVGSPPQHETQNEVRAAMNRACVRLLNERGRNDAASRAFSRDVGVYCMREYR